MRHIVAATAALALLVLTARAEDSAVVVLDKAIAALGGEANLAKAGTATWTAKGTIRLGGDDNSVTLRASVQGLDHYRSEFEGEIGGMAVKGVTTLAGDKGWREINEVPMEMDQAAVAAERRNVYLQMVPVTILPLKGKGFRLSAPTDEKVGDTPAVAVKATGPDGKDFTLTFAKETGLPLRLSARVAGFGGGEVAQEWSFADYKDFGGARRATRVEVTRDGDKFLSLELADVKAVASLPPDTFAGPK